MNNFAELCLAPPPYGAAPLQPTKMGAKCLSALVLDNQDRALSQKREKRGGKRGKTKRKGKEQKERKWLIGYSSSA